MKRRFFIFITLILSLSLLISCNTSNKAQITDALMSAQTEAEREDPEAEYYRIFISSDASPELVAAALELAESVEYYTETDAAVEYDGSEYIKRDDTVTIYLGYSDNDKAKSAFGGLKKEDYLCRFEDGNYYIGGRTESATLEALGIFSERLLPYADNSILMNPTEAFEHKGEYKVSNVTLNGYPLSDFVIVADGDEWEFAAYLGSIIADMSGYVLDVRGSGGLSDKEKCIIFSDANEKYDREGNDVAYIFNDENDVVVLSDDRYRMYSATEEILKKLLDDPDENGNTSFLIDREMTVTADTTNFTHSSFFADTACEPDMKVVSDFYMGLEKYGADIVSVVISDGITADLVFEIVPADYGFAKLGKIDGYIFALFYRKNELTFENSDTENVGGASIITSKLSAPDGKSSAKVVTFFAANDPIETIDVPFEDDELVFLDLFVKNDGALTRLPDGFSRVADADASAIGDGATLVSFVSDNFYVRRHETSDEGSGTFTFGEYREEFVRSYK